MKKKLSILCTFLFLCSSIPSAKELVWAPIFDQYCQAEWDPIQPASSRVNMPQGNPDFPLTATEAQVKATIANSISIAYSKGIRVIDFLYYFRSLDLDTIRITDPAQRGYFRKMAHMGEFWLEAVNTFNNARTSNFLKIRIRVPADYGAISVMARSNQTRYQSYDSIIGANPCFKESDGTTFNFLNISRPEIRGMIGDYAKYVIDRVRMGITDTNKTKIQHVTFVFDGGGESSLYGDDKGTWISFTPARYTGIITDIRYRIAYFSQRAKYLNATYKVFADSVHSRGLKAAIFYENFAFDDWLRGAFDLYTLLKGTGIDHLHTCTVALRTWDPSTPPGSPYPNARYTDNIRFVASSAQPAIKLGIPFDVEFTWPHYYQIAGEGQSLTFVPNHLTTGNAVSYYEQALAGLDYGADGITYCNWPMVVFRQTPSILNTQNSYGTPVEWRNILGNNTTSYYRKYNIKGAYIGLYSVNVAFNSNHINGTGGTIRPPSMSGYLLRTIPSPLSAPAGIFSASNMQQHAAATNAIFISTYGRMAAGIAQIAGDATNGADWATYLAWFDQLQLTSTMNTTKVDILTEGMLEDNPNLFSSYSRVYFPFETSRTIGAKAYNTIINLSTANKNKIYFQTAKGAAVASSNYSTWVNSRPLIYAEPAMVTNILEVINH